MAQERPGKRESAHIGRRAVIGGMLAGTLAGEAHASPNLHRQVEIRAAALAAAMAALHGGEWWVQVDHEAGVAAVSLVRACS